VNGSSTGSLLLGLCTPHSGVQVSLKVTDQLSRTANYKTTLVCQ
jgi:hypothetical protein